MDVKKRELAVEDLPEGPPVSLDLFFRVMEVLLRQEQGRALGSLSVMALSEVNKQLRYYTESYRQTPKYWYQRFKKEFLPYLMEQWWRNRMDQMQGQAEKEFLESIKNVELIRFRNNALTKWRSFTPGTDNGEEINYFFLYLAHLITFLFVYRNNQYPRKPEVVDLVWKGPKQSFMLRVELSPDRNEEKLDPKIFKIIAYDKGGHPISYASWMYSTPIWKFLSPYLQRGNISGSPYTFIPPTYGPIDAIQLFYRALTQGWRFGTEIKDVIPSHILACLNCGESATSLQQCGGCLNQTTVYCDASCQQAHWSKHKEACSWTTKG